MIIALALHCECRINHLAIYWVVTYYYSVLNVLQPCTAQY